MGNKMGNEVALPTKNTRANIQNIDERLCGWNLLKHLVGTQLKPNALGLDVDFEITNLHH